MSSTNKIPRRNAPLTTSSSAPPVEEPWLVRRRARILPLLLVFAVCLLGLVLIIYGPMEDAASSSGFRIRGLHTAFTDGGVRVVRGGGDGDAVGQGGLSASAVMAGIRRRQAQGEGRMRGSMKTPEERAYEAAYITQRDKCMESDRRGVVFEWNPSSIQGICKPLPGSSLDVVQVADSTVTRTQPPGGGGTKAHNFALFAVPPSSLDELRGRHTDAINGTIAELAKSSGSTEWATTIVNAYMSYVFETSWLMPKWSDYSPRMLAGLRDAIRTNTTTGGGEAATPPVLQGHHTGQAGLYELNNFCVTSDGKLMGPPQPLPQDGSKARSPLGPFLGRDEHPLLRTMADVSPFLHEAVPINHRMPELYNNKTGQRPSLNNSGLEHSSSSSLNVPPFLPLTVMLYPMTGFSSLSNAGHNMHRLASLNAIRDDMSVDLLLTLTSIVPTSSSVLSPHATEKVAKSLFNNACGTSTTSSSSSGGAGGRCGEGSGKWVSGGLATMGFGPHYQVLGLPISSLNIPTRCGGGGNVPCTDDHRRLFLEAAMLGRRGQNGGADDTSLSLQPPSPFMCFKKGVVYQNHLGPDFHGKEFDASSLSARAVFRGAKVATPIVLGGGSGGARHDPGTFKEITIVGADTSSIFLNGNSTTDISATTKGGGFLDGNSQPPSNLTTDLSDNGGAANHLSTTLLSKESNFNKKRWHYAMGMKTWASVRKRELLMGLRDRATHFEERILPPIINISVMINGEIQQRPLSRDPEGLTSSSSILRVLFVTRTSSRYIPGFSSFAAHLSRGFPRMEFQFVEDMSPPQSSMSTAEKGGGGGGMDWFLGRSARHADIMLGVHGGGLTNAVYLPKAASSSIASVGGSVLVEIGNSYFIRSTYVQNGMYGTFTASLGVPHAQLTYTSIPFRTGPANISLSALQDSVALGVCMWCSHNTENPHARGPEINPSGKHQMEAYFNQRCPSKVQSLAASAAPFDEPPLPQRLWDRCCRCVFSRWGDANQLKKTTVDAQGDGSDPGAWLLRYDIPMAPLLRDGVSTHVTDREESDLFKRGLKGMLVRSGVCVGCSYDSTECLIGAVRLGMLKFAAHADATFTREWVSRTLLKDMKMAAKVMGELSPPSNPASLLLNQTNNNAAAAITAGRRRLEEEGGGDVGDEVGAAVTTGSGSKTKPNIKFNFLTALDPHPFRTRVSNIASNESKRTFDEADYTSHCGPVMFLLATVDTVHKTGIMNMGGIATTTSGVLEMLLQRFIDDSSCMWNQRSNTDSASASPGPSEHFVDVGGVAGDVDPSRPHIPSSSPSSSPITMTSYTALEGALKGFVSNYCEKVHTLGVGRKVLPGGRFQIAAVSSSPQPVYLHRHRSIRVKKRT